ncbi:MAG: class I fructose-bisphosphate aldolase family protein [Candidatus Diapherotrites archaeon]|uniref:2-amino-3,7-dideoxy-D-threo-hept-6-ulosonate synthase n=1 Tax=Candidatus Iainarchaeum sp. TaxID=3101447 RepID=A0A938YY45_9ARCH|nr:class I fructose-bisphosphate aldolase family protein [Candidatus Diapherotrites archaeon]
MNMIGKRIRLERIMNRNTGKMVIIPMDHGVTVGPIPGLEDMPSTIGKVTEGGANAIVLHKGIVTAGHRGTGKDIGLIVHLSASTSAGPDPNRKINVCTVEEALKLGADAVSVQVNIGADTESEMLADLAITARKCNEWNVPLLAMMYPRGPNVKNEADVELVKLAARVGAELGADIVKTNYTGSPETFREVVKGCSVPVVIAGGSKGKEIDCLKKIEDSISAGGSGVCMGRNSFQHKDPTAFVRAVCKVVHEGISAEDAAKSLK